VMCRAVQGGDTGSSSEGKVGLKSTQRWVSRRAATLRALVQSLAAAAASFGSW